MSLSKGLTLTGCKPLTHLREVSTLDVRKGFQFPSPHRENRLCQRLSTQAGLSGPMWAAGFSPAYAHPLWAFAQRPDLWEESPLLFLALLSLPRKFENKLTKVLGKP